MFYTCTMNPAIDLFVATTNYLPKIVNRSLADEVQANGKGVNVSFILKRLGIENTALGFSGGFTGKYIEEVLQQNGIGTRFIQVEGLTRINVFTQVQSENTEYKLVNQGPKITENQMNCLLQQIAQLSVADHLIISGSNPQGIPDEFILQIARLSQQNKFKLILDISSPISLQCLSFQPYCLKPNEEELASWFGKSSLSQEELLDYGAKLIELGAQSVLVSAGGRGSFYFSKDTILFANAPTGNVINTACAGDTLLGTFIGALQHGKSVEEALSFGVAAGSSTAFSPGLTDFKDVPELEKQIKVSKIK